MGRVAAFLMHSLYYFLTGIAGVFVAFLPRRRTVDRRERVGDYLESGLPESPVWIHAVSAGEAAVGAAVIRELAAHCPEARPVLATTTDSGIAMARRRLPPGVPVVRSFLDTPQAVRRFFGRVRPRLILILEMELWPNLLRGAARRGVPVLIGNGRMPDREYRRYRLFRFYFSRLLAGVELVSAGSGEDAAKYRALGARAEEGGDIKYDLLPPSVGSPAKESDLVIGSVHREEEGVFVGLLSALFRRGALGRAVIAPRDVRRGGALLKKLGKAGLRAVRRSGGAETAPGEGVLVLDSVGELAGRYGMASLAVIGGSFSRRVGGHNPLEAAVQGVPVLFGPCMRHFGPAAAALLAAGGALQVADGEALADQAMILLLNRERSVAMGHAARTACLSRMGGAARLAFRIGALIR